MGQGDEVRAGIYASGRHRAICLNRVDALQLNPG